ncbi:phenylacetate-coenzyme A ligase PaaK-like adenylate-forming protein [Breoghania corrubedonensis]|uniref:Phenylacetate-coenzyme A ligase PaaK-like adenylate-forming protein n=1 Tax=Breoghania corrubedonensis TaxID=665038 RepID=A0A2T5V7V6_9HYPH|nr:AMP-binding protein [Breoghania corrubedonensis]PTW59821.1 phenylacetate-coenzyme A ligase PaaK-like adenylate-forming protein [Breoghania corrubedonensis]
MADTLFLDDWDALTRERDTRFSATLDRVFAYHPFYKDLLTRARLRRRDISGVADLVKLPVTTHKDYLANPAGFVLAWPEAASAEESIVWDVMHTMQASGPPAPFVSTTYDFLNILALNRNMLRLRGTLQSDSILNLFPLTRHPHGAFARAMNAAAAYNIPVTAAMPGASNARQPDIGNPLDEVVAIAARSCATILWGVPSYIRKMVARAEELGVMLPHVRLVFVSGEGFAAAARSDLIDRLKRLGAKEPKISVSYGASEMQGGMVECAPGTGFHNPAPDQFCFEAVDPDTHKPVPDGEEGLILLTHLDRRGTVMLRYALGDVARLTRERCPHCGALTERIIGTPRRTGGFVKIRGRLIDPQVLSDALAGETAVADFQAVVEKEEEGDVLSRDRLRIKIAPDGKPDETLSRRLAERVKTAIGIRPVIELTTAEDPMLAVRGWAMWPLVDLRKKKRR